MPILVTSAGSANGGGYGAILSFGAKGELIGPFSSDPRIVDPRGLSLDPCGALIYLNSGDDRVLALDHHGEVVRDSGRIAGLDPGGGVFGRDRRYYLGTRRRRTILAMPAALAGSARATSARRRRALPARVRLWSRRPALPRLGRRSLRGGRQHDRRVRSRWTTARTSLGRRPRVEPARSRARSERAHRRRQ